MRRKSRRRVCRDSSAIWPAISTPGRAGADDDEGEQPLLLPLVPGELGHLEGAEDAAAQLQGVVDRLHAGREAGELVVAEVRLPGPGGHDEVVVGRRGPPVEDLRGDGPGGQVDVGDVAEQHGRVGWPLRISRVDGAMSPSDRIPVATW